MPNHVTNQITFGSDAAAVAAFQKMLEDVREKGEPYGSIDFNKLIPMPREPDIERSIIMEKGLELYQVYAWEMAQAGASGEFAVERKWAERRLADPAAWAAGKRAYENIQKHGFPTWYEWSIQNWGTKWNAYQCQPLGRNDDTMVFLTAWDAVPNVLAALSRKYPEQAVTYRWADEDIGFNVGEMVFQNGKCVERNEPQGGSREAYEMAARIQGIDLASCGLYLKADQSGYEYRDQAEPAPKNKQKGRDHAK